MRFRFRLLKDAQRIYDILQYQRYEGEWSGTLTLYQDHLGIYYVEMNPSSPIPFNIIKEG